MSNIFNAINIEAPDSILALEALSVFGFQAQPHGAPSFRARVSGGAVTLDLHADGALPRGSSRAAFFGLDIYSSNADLSGQLAEAAGWNVNPPVPYWTAGYPIIESRAHHLQTGLTIFAAQTPPPLAVPTALDTENGRLHSDVVTAVWFIDETHVEREIDFWTKSFQLTQFESTTWYDARSQSRLFQLDESRRIGGALFTDDRENRMLEILFLEGGGVLRPGTGVGSLHSVSFEATGFEPNTAAARSLGGGAQHRGDFFESPAGIIFEVRD